MNPITSIASRYANKLVSNKYYNTISFSGSTLPILSGTTLLGHKASGTTSGYIYVPYILQQSNSIIIDREWARKIIREGRKEKLKKLGWS